MLRARHFIERRNNETLGRNPLFVFDRFRPQLLLYVPRGNVALKEKSNFQKKKKEREREKIKKEILNKIRNNISRIMNRFIYILT